ncbi:MAG: prolyl-tRNA synthetase associated domain-containing protein [Rhodobacteraceae bacterium]|nr:prolyl-tRNA synthetase associated domain-containing protein [Paracoccaceae bacterium]
MNRPPLTEAELLAKLEQLEIPFTVHRHPPLFTVEESQALRGELPGTHVKNMFMKDKKGGLWLITCLEDRRIRIRDLEKALAAPKMSFAKPDVMMAAIGVSPGAVTPLAAANAAVGEISLVVDASVMAAGTVNCHPLHNEATIALTSADLARFLTEVGHPPILVDFGALEQEGASG